ncbi:hypothetical protein AVEN_272201-1 [Araneus ventricosus]|uniref:Uncharacterized protein n=1 Tax=Araneus ventricosus TaxID=182803 RepID=A0A4Y2QT70_ARAVE|nr:hypothetical protein AVEN_272201-1 [Araneus ventricosus]
MHWLGVREAPRCYLARLVGPLLTMYCPTARRKTLNRVASRRRVEERRETDIKSAAIFGKTKRSSLGENSFSTEVQSEMRRPSVLPTPNEMKPFSSPPKCSGISRFHNDRHRDV